MAGTSVRHEVIMAGLGGGGVLTAGRVLGTAGMNEYAHSLWYPSYASASRGGPCECTIVLSDESINSQLLDQCQVVMVLHPSQLKPFESRVRPGGLMIAEAMGLNDRPARTDVRLVAVPAVETAMKTVGSIQGGNLVLLGAYVGLVKSVPASRIEEVIESRFKGREAALKSNLTAFRAGLELAQTLSPVAAGV